MEKVTLRTRPRKPEDVASFAEELSSVYGRDNISPSALKKLVEDSQAFYKGYIRGEWDDIVSPRMIEGSAVHKAIETYYNDVAKSTQELINIAVTYFAVEVAKNGESIKWGDKDSVESSIVRMSNAITNFIANDPFGNCDEITSECKVFAPFTFQSELESPLFMSCIMDSVKRMRNSKKYVVVDYKLVSMFETAEESFKKYIYQYGFYYYACLHETGEAPSQFIICQIKPKAGSINLTVAELQLLLSKNKITYPDKSKKDVLISLAIASELIEKPTNINLLIYDYDVKTLAIFEELYWRGIYMLYVACTLDDLIFVPSALAWNSSSFNDFMLEATGDLGETEKKDIETMPDYLLDF